MATFHVGQQTHPAVLPQQLALELDSADNPGNRDETGVEGRMAPGVEHVRGETSDCSPAAGRVTPILTGGEKGREAHPVVFVVDRHGVPLQPTTSVRARKLLRSGRAVVARHTPFVIRLKDRTAAESGVDGVELGIDPGSKHTGIAVFTTQECHRRGLYAIQVAHRGTTIRDKLTTRSAFRRGRRSRNQRYRAPRFHNRTRPNGWLAPSLRHRVDTTVSWVERVARWAPVRAVHVERVAFDPHVLAVGQPLEAVEYCHGTLHGTEIREYLLTKWGRACAYCGATGVPLNIDHIRARSRGGSDRISNLTLACIPCNQAKGNRPVEEFLTKRPNVLARILAQTKTPLRDSAAVNSTRWALWHTLEATFPVVRAGSGGRTKWNRTRNDLPKTHTLDALCVGELENIAQYPTRVLAVTATGRGTYARTRTDKHGFPRLYMPRTKTAHGFRTGDLARAVVSTGKNAGSHTGRIAVRTTGKFNVRTPNGLIQGIHHRHFRLLQRADGYGYTIMKEGRASCPA